MKIVIIGGGVAGLAIGWRLAQAGEQVTVLERGQPGAGATWASAGMLAVTAELLDSTPAEIDFARYSNSLWPDFAKEIEAASGRKIGYAIRGALILAEDAPGLDRLARRAADQSSLEVVNVARVREIEPRVEGETAGGLWASQEAMVDNRALGLALAVAFQRAGGKLSANEAVVRIEEYQGRVVAHTPFRLHHGDAFVLAAGAWSGQLEPEVAPVSPVKGQMILLSPPAGESPPETVVWGNGIYAVPRGAALAVGATMEDVGFDTAITTQARADLRQAAQKLMPGLQRWTLTDQWAGLRPRAPDGLPLLGPTAVEGLWLASGQFRNGILFAPAVAESLVNQILNWGDGIAAFDPRRFSK